MIRMDMQLRFLLKQIYSIIMENKRNPTLRVEARMHNLGGIQRNCLTDRDQVRKAKALTELYLTNKKSFYKYIGNKRKTRELGLPAI